MVCEVKMAATSWPTEEKMPECSLPEAANQVTLLLKRLKKGDREAPGQLIPLVIDELRRLARHYMRNERVGHTLQPTALVNEAYLRLIGYRSLDWQSRSHFIGVAASVMRQVLTDYARRRLAAKRGADADDVPLADLMDSLSVEQSQELLALNDALDRLKKMNQRHSQIVEMRYFGGLSIEETAEALEVSPITVKRDWAVARAWLCAELKGKA
jgi:RNA polymerase sigma factor (TIGR02999 family)